MLDIFRIHAFKLAQTFGGGQASEVILYIRELLFDAGDNTASDIKAFAYILIAKSLQHQIMLVIV